MVELSRYNVGGKADDLELINKLRIKDAKSLNDAETVLLNDSYSHFAELINSDGIRFEIKLIFDIHRYFLSPLYEWAGSIRSVEVSKGGMLFCPSLQISKELLSLEKVININLPTKLDNKLILSKKLSIIHCEFNAIHPFREGNGRTIRLFLDMLALNAGFKMLDYSSGSHRAYIKACVKGMSKDYEPMQKFIYKCLSKRDM